MPDRRYWDTSVFFAYFADQADRRERCRPIVRRAEAGEMEIVTSALSVAESLYVPDGGELLPDENREEVRRFFQHDFIVMVQIDRPTALRSQDLVWDYGVAPKDALHLASALTANVPQFDTYDEKLYRLDAEIGDSPVLRISEPYVEPTAEELQRGMFDEEDEEET